MVMRDHDRIQAQNPLTSSGSLPFTMTGKVLVAGATGYLGSYILQALRKHGIATAALVRPASKFRTELRVSELAAAGTEIVRADAQNPNSLAG